MSQPRHPLASREVSWNLPRGKLLCRHLLLLLTRRYRAGVLANMFVPATPQVLSLLIGNARAATTTRLPVARQVHTGLATAVAASSGATLSGLHAQGAMLRRRRGEGSPSSDTRDRYCLWRWRSLAHLFSTMCPAPPRAYLLPLLLAVACFHQLPMRSVQQLHCVTVPDAGVRRRSEHGMRRVQQLRRN